MQVGSWEEVCDSWNLRSGPGCLGAWGEKKGLCVWPPPAALFVPLFLGRGCAGYQDKTLNFLYLDKASRTTNSSKLAGLVQPKSCKGAFRFLLLWFIFIWLIYFVILVQFIVHVLFFPCRGGEGRAVRRSSGDRHLMHHNPQARQA